MVQWLKPIAEQKSFDVSIDGEFWNLIALAIAAISSVATVIIAFLAWRQLFHLNAESKSGKEREKRWKTVEACERIDADPLYNKACDHVRDQVHKDLDYSVLDCKNRETWSSVVTILNNLDSLCIGVVQGVYDEDIVFDHHSVSIINAYKKFIEIKHYDIDPDHYKNLKTVHDLWTNTRPRYNPTQ